MPGYLYYISPGLPLPGSGGSVIVDWDPGCVLTVRSVCSLDLAISAIYMIWICTVHVVD